MKSAITVEDESVLHVHGDSGSVSHDFICDEELCLRPLKFRLRLLPLLLLGLGLATAAVPLVGRDAFAQDQQPSQPPQ